MAWYVLSVRPRELRLVIQHHKAAMMTISCSSFIVRLVLQPTSAKFQDCDMQEIQNQEICRLSSLMLTQNYQSLTMTMEMFYLKAILCAFSAEKYSYSTKAMVKFCLRAILSMLF